MDACWPRTYFPPPNPRRCRPLLVCSPLQQAYLLFFPLWPVRECGCFFFCFFLMYLDTYKPSLTFPCCSLASCFIPLNSWWQICPGGKSGVCGGSAKKTKWSQYWWRHLKPNQVWRQFGFTKLFFSLCRAVFHPTSLPSETFFFQMEHRQTQRLWAFFTGLWTFATTFNDELILLNFLFFSFLLKRPLNMEIDR